MTDPLAPLRAKFLQRCEEDLAAIRNGDPLDDLVARVHRLAGTAAIFGFEELGLLAQQLDDRARRGDLSLDDLAPLEKALADVSGGGAAA